ncbi:efflux RND transporter periplasmic adaptor subunit [Nguyenibacter vanlangensis]|uniref:Efflux RND transporter periplasmic adaptor subunit n=1 Tax=Nguyenibacter vanlangensis TaxID=1216886 RepID=A0A7Y7ITJ3_9PROT|nr:efflux RND transporter periplasmic adaptor subunit [Nguyenibacter vanlangensis]NVN10109.1 efflux RND transporter periplasmic adaptor subunit [Nguyenibacter vanlangensis]
MDLLSRTLCQPALRRTAWLVLLMALSVSGLRLLTTYRPLPVIKTAARVPVAAVRVEPSDVPVGVATEGHIQALQSVTVRTQVPGQIQTLSFHEGQMVTAGQQIAQIDPRPLQAAVDQDQATLDRDAANLANALLDLARYVSLVGKGLVSAQQVATQRAQVTQLRATIRADQAVLDKDRIQLSYTMIVSPITGIAGLRFVDAGNIVSPSDSNGMVVVTQVEPIALLFAVPQAELPRLQSAIARHGLTSIRVEAWTAQNDRRLDVGALAVVNNQVDAASGTVMLKALLPNAGHLLWPGQFVNVRMITQIVHGGLTVPLAAIQQGNEGAFVWRVGPDGKVQMQEIATMSSQDGQALVTTGLSAGDVVVTDGQYGLVPGRKVQVAPAGARGLRNSGTDTLGISP